MIFRHKKLRTAMAMMAILSIFGGTVNNVYADGVYQNKSIVSVKSDQIHKLNTVLKHETKDEESSANKYVQRSYLKVENNKKYIIIVLSSGQLMKSVVPTVDGNEVEYTNTLEEENRTITFEIESLDQDIRINFEINPFEGFVVKAACRVEAQIEDSSSGNETDKEEDKEENDTITGATPDKNPSDEEDKDDSVEEDKENEEDKEEDNNTVDQEKPEDNKQENDKNEIENTGNSNTTYKNGYYQIKNIVILDNEVGYSMVRNILNETSNLEIKNGKYYLTFEMAQSSLMKDIVIKANSKTLSYTKTNVGNDTVRIKLQIPSLSSVLNISSYVTAMGRTVDFDLKLNQSTLKFVSSNEEGKLPENNNSNNINNNNGSNSSNNFENNNSSNNLVENNTTIKGKLYTIKNEIVHDNETGRKMARTYLNESSKIEEINGQLYLTLTFTGVDLMQNHKFYVNGSLASHEVVSSTSSSKSYRFKINSLSDDIKVNVFIVPMNTTVEFGVKLLENTYTFVKDFEVASNGKLPQTGSVINSEALFMGGSLITVLGAFLGRKKRK
ncbi:MAG: NEAT domain-containing protein [Intestinibacter sp.]|uniref:NEAT domain-containing protein n=1 Tax=Intestinibacter sp. TaxID=1965304 RepID=UPI002A808C38|nr:NEAT domain-containing protein [Intestinibacter sp.]MDY4573746.1 NEAT domain-containing protein [Intestinibacter sp.]